ncbi:hypothetical protein FQZ97_1100860 [compost metagenome]
MIGHDDFHPDTWDGHRAKLLAGPIGRDPHPATALVAVELGAIPMKLDFHPPRLIAEDVFTLRTGHARGLAHQDRFAREQRRAIKNIPRNCRKTVAVALGKTVPWSGITGDRLFQDLGLLPRVLDAE